MTTLQQFFDKENVGAGAVSVKNRAVSGLSLKGTQDNASLVTPRRALGNINRNVSSSRQTPGSKKSLKTPGPMKIFTENTEKQKPRKALSSISENKQLSESKSKRNIEGPLSVISSNVSTKNAPLVDEIEHIHKPVDMEDDYEDIYPKKERVSSYIDKLISWRPSCFKSWDIDGDYVEEDEVQELLLIDEIPSIPTMTRDASSLCEEMLYADDIEPMPEMDISLLALDDFMDLPQELDEKFAM